MKNIKKNVSIILAAIMFTLTSPMGLIGGVCKASQEQGAEIFTLSIGQNSANVFGEVKESDVQPIIRNDRTMLPARFVAENLGAEVSWDGANRVVTVKSDSVEIKLTIDSSVAVVNGVEEMLDSPAFIENDRTYTPVRFIAEKLGSSVTWDAATKTVIMSKPVKMSSLVTGTLTLKNFNYKYEAGGMMVEYNEGAIGGMNLSAEVIAPSNVSEVLISQWSDQPFTKAQIEEAINSMVEIWKREGFEVIKTDVPFTFETSHPVDPEDMGKKMYVLLIGLDTNCNAVGYAVVEEIVGN